jgi:hypothetical protein
MKKREALQDVLFEVRRLKAIGGGKGCHRALPECCSEGYYEGGGGLKYENLEVRAEE